MSFKIIFEVKVKNSVSFAGVSSIADGKVVFREVNSFIFDHEKKAVIFDNGAEYSVNWLSVDGESYGVDDDYLSDSPSDALPLVYPEPFRKKMEQDENEFMSEMVDIFIKARNEKIEEISNDGSWKENDWIVVEYALRKVFGE